MKVKMDMLLADDLELLLREINEFCGSGTPKLDEVPESLENYLQYVAKTGNTVFPWQHVRPLFKHKLNHAIDQFPGPVTLVEPCVHERFDLFRSAPFTIQRLAELIIQPQKHYKDKAKFVCALEKTVFVVSTVEPRAPPDVEFSNGNDQMEDESEAMAYEDSEHQDIHMNSFIPAVPEPQSPIEMDEVMATVGHIDSTVSGDTLPTNVSSTLDPTISTHILPTGGEGGDQVNFESSYVREMLKLPPGDDPIEAVHEVLGYTQPSLHQDIPHVEGQPSEITDVLGTVGDDSPVSDMLPTVSSTLELDPAHVLPAENANEDPVNFESSYVQEMLKLPPHEDVAIAIDSVSVHHEVLYAQPPDLSNVNVSQTDVMTDPNSSEVNPSPDQQASLENLDASSGDAISTTVSSSLDTPQILQTGCDGDQVNFESSFVGDVLKIPPPGDEPIQTVHEVLGYTQVSQDEAATVDSTSTSDIVELASVALVTPTETEDEETK